jgi:flagellin-like hook-associated protein FlgL
VSSISSLSNTLSNSINKVQLEIYKVQNELATGVRSLNSAESGEVTRLSGQVTGYNQVMKNIEQAQNIIEVAQTGLSSITKILNQLTALALQSSNSTLSTSDRASLNSTFQNLLTQIDSIVSGASLNGTNLINGSGSSYPSTLTLTTPNGSSLKLIDPLEHNGKVYYVVDFDGNGIHQANALKDYTIVSILEPKFNIASAFTPANSTFAMNGYSVVVPTATELIDLFQNTTKWNDVNNPNSTGWDFGAYISSTLDPTYLSNDLSVFPGWINGSAPWLNDSKIPGTGGGGVLAFRVDGAISNPGMVVQTGISGGDVTSVPGQPASTTVLGISSLDISDAIGAQASLTAITLAIDSISSKQSNLSAASVGLQAINQSASSLSTNLQNTVNSIQGVDQAALQAKLQQLNNQQSIDYYLVSQLNSEESANLTIFR